MNRADDILVLTPLRFEALALGSPPRIRVVKTGLGPKRSRRAVTRLRSDESRSVVVVGFSGALDDDLAPGDVVVASEIVGPDRERIACHAPKRLIDALEAEGIRVVLGPIACADHIVRGDERRRLREETGAKCVEMESAWLRPLADRRSFAVARAVVDTPSRELHRPWHTAFGAIQAARSLRRIGTALSRWNA
jgi:4-hydroxy-3-methylbut-2-enyl diphosphate reductase